MKRRTRFALCIGALAGAVPLSAVSAAAASAAPAPDPGVMVATTSGSPPRVLATVRVQAPTPSLQRVTVVSGDTLSGIGARTHRSWPALASYNRIPNPDLIFPGQVVVVPPASYIPPAVAYAAPVVPSYRPPPATQHSTRSYTPQRSTYVSSQRSYSQPTYQSGGKWGCIAQHESGNTNANTGNGYYGYFQFSASTWHAVGGTGLPSDHSYAEQLAMAQKLQSEAGWSPWPNTSAMC